MSMKSKILLLIAAITFSVTLTNAQIIFIPDCITKCRCLRFQPLLNTLSKMNCSMRIVHWVLEVIWDLLPINGHPETGVGNTTALSSDRGGICITNLLTTWIPTPEYCLGTTFCPRNGPGVAPVGVAPTPGELPIPGLSGVVISFQTTLQPCSNWDTAFRT